MVSESMDSKRPWELHFITTFIYMKICIHTQEDLRELDQSTVKAYMEGTLQRIPEEMSIKEKCDYFNWSELQANEGEN